MMICIIAILNSEDPEQIRKALIFLINMLRRKVVIEFYLCCITQPFISEHFRFYPPSYLNLVSSINLPKPFYTS